nr:lethal(2) giant larvae protein like sro77 [Quercus suber]
MAHLLRGKQAGIQNDLSAGITPALFAIDDLGRYGINSQITAVAYDPVQSLLAVGTKCSQYGPGQIQVFGQHRVQITLPLPRPTDVKILQFCAEKLICIDSRHAINVYSLETKTLVSAHSPPGTVMALCSDPTLDYALLGMQSGDILAYDLDRENLAPFKIPNLWEEVESRARVSSIVSIQFHPRDIGQILVGYTHGAVIFSFKLNKAVRSFQYEIPRGAPGGDGDPTMTNTIRRPRLTQAVWHPTGTFIMTGYEDSSIVFWDTLRDGRILMARTLADTNIASPGAAIETALDGSSPLAVKEPLFRLDWCANSPDPEDTIILIAGGMSTKAPSKGLTLFEMGRTPVYATSPWTTLISYFESPKRQRFLPTPPGAEVVDYCLIPRASPHFAGAHDPIAIIALLSSGELLTLTFPSGMPISPTNQLHISTTFVHPFIKRLGIARTDRERWLGMTEKRAKGPSILTGGAEAARPMRRFEKRDIALTAHADGTIRLWDVGAGDEIENDQVLQVDVSRAVGRFDAVEVTQMSLAGASGELAVGLKSGEVMVFQWSTNKTPGREPPPSIPNQPGRLTVVSDRVDPSLSEGLIPAVLLDQREGPVSAVRMSEIGFVAAGFESGVLAVVDMRGPAVIYTASIADFQKNHGRSSLRRRSGSAAGSKPEWATQIEFSIMMCDGDEYSSILLHVGTNLGHIATLKIVPDSNGRYKVQYVGSVSVESEVMSIYPIHADSGTPAHASQVALGRLGDSIRINGVLVAITPTGIHIFRPSSSKGAHKSFDSVFCDAAAVVKYQDQGSAICGLFGDGSARIYSIPSLREIGSINLSKVLDVRRYKDAVITPTGHILGFTGPSELALLSIWGTGQPLIQSQDQLYNPQALIPPRPTISTVQWVTGTQYITPADMDILIGGPNRPPSKRMIAQARAEEQQRREAARPPASSGVNVPTAGVGYWDYLQKQIQERTEQLGLMGDSMERVEQNSKGWADDVNKFVKNSKRSAATGSKFLMLFSRPEIPPSPLSFMASSFCLLYFFIASSRNLCRFALVE